MASNEPLRIAYCFADYGGEAEALAGFGDVHRYTIEPRANPWCTETTAVDLMEETPEGEFDLWIGHPSCAKYTNMPNVDPDDHEDQIPRARELAEAMAEHYIIENRPAAPLDDPTVLDGRMFGLPIRYERAFETSFRVPQPPRNARLTQNADTSSFFYSERSPLWWKAVKGLTGDYPPEHQAKNILPLPYVRFLIRAWLEATGQAEHVADYSDYEARMDERRAREANNELSDFA